jgi:hypothetical protein
MEKALGRRKMPAEADGTATPAPPPSTCGGQDPQRKPVRLVRPPVKLSEGPFNQDVATQSMIANLKRGMHGKPTPEQVQRLTSELINDIGSDFTVVETDEEDVDVSAVTAS